MRTQQEVSALAQPRPWWWNGVVGVEESGEEDGLEDTSVLFDDEPLPWWWDVLYIDDDGRVWINEENFVMIRLEECVHLSPDTACVHQ